MHLRAASVIKRSGIFQRLTGLSVAEFERLLPVFTQAYEQQVIQPRLNRASRVRGVGGGQKGALKEVADKLLFILVYVRVYPLLFLQGMLFGISEGKACTWVKVLLPALDAALEQKHVRPNAPEGVHWKRLSRSILNSKSRGFSLMERSGPFIAQSQTLSRKRRIPGRRSGILRNM